MSISAILAIRRGRGGCDAYTKDNPGRIQASRHLDSGLDRRSGEGRKSGDARAPRPSLCRSQGLASNRGIPLGCGVGKNCQGNPRSEANAWRRQERAHHRPHLLQACSPRPEYQRASRIRGSVPGIRCRPYLSRRVHRHLDSRRSSLLHHDRSNGPVGAGRNCCSRFCLSPYSCQDGETFGRSGFVRLSMERQSTHC
ncbi:hypothetical protein GALL_300640 [mine drainage metagenome]|uniref:Uncharacterized protein n=1 Tax=mine drainage metagenome TaxID=410659 RepID=A0A1J5QWI3_9ZZZZ